jgi:hypothetical protein
MNRQATREELFDGIDQGRVGKEERIPGGLDELRPPDVVSDMA